MPLQLVSLFRVCSADVSILLSECKSFQHGTYMLLAVVSICSIFVLPSSGTSRVLVNTSLSIL